MGEAKRRRDAGEKPADIKIAPRKRAMGFRFAHVRRREVQQEDGTVVAVNFFSPVDEQGNGMFEETPDGPRPVLIASVPQPIRRAVIATPTLARVGM